MCVCVSKLRERKPCKAAYKRVSEMFPQVLVELVFTGHCMIKRDVS